MSLTQTQFMSVTNHIILRFHKYFPSCESEYEGKGQTCFRKNSTEWFRIKFTPHPCTGFIMTLTGPKPRTMDLEAEVGYFGGDTLCFSHMEEERYVLRLARKYFIQCGYVSDDEE